MHLSSYGPCNPDLLKAREKGETPGERKYIFLDCTTVAYMAFFAFQNIKKKKIASLRHNHNVPIEYGCSTISTPSLSSVVGSPKKLWVQKKQEGRAQLVRIAGSKQTSREPDKEKATAAALLTAHCCSVMNSSAQARCSVTKSTVGHLPVPFWILAICCPQGRGTLSIEHCSMSNQSFGVR